MRAFSSIIRPTVNIVVIIFIKVYSIEELKDLSQKGAGSKASPYYKDSSGQLRFKKTDTLVTSTSNKAVYQ
jgi:hypothetical protein